MLVLLYFHHQLHITQFLQVLTYIMVTFCEQLSCTDFYTCFSDLWALPSGIPCRLCSCHMILESAFIALQPIVVTKIPWGHHAPAYSPVNQVLLRVPFEGVSLLHGLP